jgi:hypothetical protein
MNEGRPEVQVIADWELTPARATKLMTANRNRPLRKKVVQALARDIVAGNFRDYSTIKVAWVPGEGEVFIDGQHRAAAVIHTGLSIRVVLIKNVDMEDQEVTDTGIRRTLGDMLKLRGEHQSTLLAATLGWKWRRLNKAYLSDLSPSAHEAMEVLDEHPGLRKMNVDATDFARTMMISQGMCQALHYDMAIMSTEGADDFWHRCRYGTDLSADSSITLLRNRLLRNAHSKHTKLDRITTSALIIKAWNAYIKGRPMENLRWRRTGPQVEVYPEMQGPAH